MNFIKIFFLGLVISSLTFNIIYSYKHFTNNYQKYCCCNIQHGPYIQYDTIADTLKFNTFCSWIEKSDVKVSVVHKRFKNNASHILNKFYNNLKILNLYNNYNKNEYCLEIYNLTKKYDQKYWKNNCLTTL